MPTADPSPIAPPPARCDWNAEYTALTAADRAGGLSAEELERLAVAAFLLGLDDEVVGYRERAHQQYLDRGLRAQALRCGFWLGFHLQNRGERAQAAGWQARLRRLVDDGPDGYFATMLTMPDAVAAMWSGDPNAALPIFERASRSAAAAADVDMFALAGVGRGSCLQMLGRWDDAAAVLDEVLVHVAAGRIAPQVTGLAYCSMISLCMQVFDLRRAQEWTAALGDWIDEQQGLVPYRGVCLVHRAEILQLRGAWPQAVAEAERACVWLDRSGEAAIGAAHYRVGELARLQGRLDAAERAYEQAIARGFDAQPGLARLRLAQGRAGAGIAGLDRALGEQQSSPARAGLLAARIDLALAVEDLSAARRWLAELAQVGPGGAPYLRALAEHSAGTVLLAAGEAAAALPRLRTACTLWQDLDAPYESALTQLALARACAALGDEDAATMGREAAQAVLHRLGATAVDGHEPAQVPVGHPLSPRQLEVLRLVATGASNRAIAQELVLSEKTVARHLSNIFAKLDLPSRSAATAYAYEHGLA